MLTTELEKVSEVKVVAEVERNRTELSVLSQIVAVADRDEIIKRIQTVYGESGVNIPALQVEAALQQQEANRVAHYAIDPSFGNKFKAARRNIKIGTAAGFCSAVGGAAYSVAHFVFNLL